MKRQPAAWKVSTAAALSYMRKCLPGLYPIRMEDQEANQMMRHLCGAAARGFRAGQRHERKRKG